MNGDYSYGPNAKVSKNRVLKLKEVISVTGLSRSSIYRKIKEKRFPRSIRLSGQSVGWLEEEIQNWIIDRIAERDV